jgi:hypothetical protein
MRAFYRGLVAFFLLGTFLYVGSRTWQGAELAFWDVLTPACEVAEAERRHEQLQAEREIVLACIEGKQQIMEEVIGRRLRLVEAAARVRALHAWWLQHSKICFTLQGRAGSSEEERWCRHVIAYLHGTLKARPDSAAVLARLEGELQDELDRYGTVRLPNGETMKDEG